MLRRPAFALVATLALLLSGCASGEPARRSQTYPSSSAASISSAAEEDEPAEDEPAETEVDDQTEEPEERSTVPGELAIVTRVIDGDTIDARIGGRILHVRLIGIDTPETVHPTEPVGCYGPAASRFTTNMLEGEEVRLEFDVEREDRYGRTLAYVWLGDRLFNELLVARGFAQVSTYPPNVKYVDEFLKAQRDARRHERGLWGPICQEPEPGPDAGDGPSNCEPSYPDVCIAPYPPDLDCGEISERGFRVTGSDPHGFDGDNDGIGCES